MLPATVPYSVPLPSMMMKPNLSSSSSSSFNACTFKQQRQPLQQRQRQHQQPNAMHLCVELVVAEVQCGVDGPERLEVDVDSLLLAVVCEDCAAEDDQTVGGTPVVQLQTLLGGCDR